VTCGRSSEVVWMYPESEWDATMTFDTGTGLHVHPHDQLSLRPHVLVGCTASSSSSSPISCLALRIGYLQMQLLYVVRSHGLSTALRVKALASCVSSQARGGWAAGWSLTYSRWSADRLLRGLGAYVCATVPAHVEFFRNVLFRLPVRLRSRHNIGYVAMHLYWLHRYHYC
jgi:hypothetical protein